MRLKILKLMLLIKFVIDWFMWRLGGKQRPLAKPLPKNKRALSPVEGKTWNPLLKYPRNESCYCGSKIKYKKCCGLNEQLVVPKEFAVQAAPIVKKIKGK